ncbi:hypothetical protein D3C72_1874110 [compost metagenome]
MVFAQWCPRVTGGLNDTEVALEHLTTAGRRTMTVGAAIGYRKALAVVVLDIVDGHQQRAALAGNETPGLEDNAGAREFLVEVIEQWHQ